MTPDAVNGIFECIGGVLMWYNVYCMWRDKQYSGVSMLPTGFFGLWGLWNLYFYAALACWYSWLGGVVLVTANIVWWSQMLKYRGVKNADIA